jgi:hypothetical protein
MLGHRAALEIGALAQIAFFIGLAPAAIQSRPRSASRVCRFSMRSVTAQRVPAKNHLLTESPRLSGTFGMEPCHCGAPCSLALITRVHGRLGDVATRADGSIARPRRRHADRE